MAPKKKRVRDPEAMRCPTCRSPWTVAFIREVADSVGSSRQRRLDQTLRLLGLLRQMKDLDEPLDPWKRAQWETWITDYENDLAEEHAELSAKQLYEEVVAVTNNQSKGRVKNV